MAGVGIRLAANKSKSLEEIHAIIHKIEDAEQISKYTQTINDVTIWTIVYEKYYYRTSSYANLTVVLTEYGQEQTACVIGSGGGESLYNFSLGANRNFAKTCVQALEECGFSVLESDLDLHSKGLTGVFERIFK